MLHSRIFYVIGLMSGSSLDGLDICYVQFQNDELRFDYKIIHAECVDYSTDFRERLRNVSQLSAYEYAKTHTELGNYFGKLTAAFIRKNKIQQVDFIASHGQTIFHQPALGFTAQIGCGAQIAAQTHCNVVADLRTTDVANQGQGAPLVPIAEKYLFPGFSCFLNIGGIANIAFHHNDTIIAYDVCAANTMLNFFAKKKGLEFDMNGDLARNGKINFDLLEDLNNIEFCKMNAPKSIGSEHIFSNWLPLFDKYKNSIEDNLATAVEHIAIQTHNSIRSHCLDKHSRLFITGGGALHSFLIERIKHHAILEVVVPDNLTVQYKEALAMAFVGLMRVLEIPNSIASVTGATKDSIGGAIYLA